MKKLLFTFLGCVLLFSFCSQKETALNKDSFFIRVDLSDNNRSCKDYVKLWVNDSLFFSAPYYTNYNEVTFENMDDVWGMKVAVFNKQGMDSIKIKLRLISLDTILFRGKRIVDTTFRYNISNIPSIEITSPRETGHFGVFDTLRTPAYFRYD